MSEDHTGEVLRYLKAASAALSDARSTLEGETEAMTPEQQAELEQNVTGMLATLDQLEAEVATKRRRS